MRLNMLGEKNISRRGFTLLEVLVVVLIAVVVTMFAVPAYKKTQYKNRYTAASGVLIELANATNMLREDFPGLAVTSAVPSGVVSTASCPETVTNNSTAWTYMHCRDYMNSLQKGGNFQGYNLAFSTVGAACGAVSCKSSNQAVACMYGANPMTEYRCAWIDFSGQLHHGSN